MPKIYNLTDTWNDGTTVFDAIKINVADTASAAGSKLLDLQIGGTSKFKVDKGGNVTLAGSITGLDQVDNTSDLDKPVSTLQATAIGVVQTDVDNHEALTNNPHTVTAAQVGLGNVDNTSDLDKPISTLTQAAIDAAGGGAFDADANTQITPSTPIVLEQATGDEAALTLDYTTNKAAGNDTGLLINQTDTLSPGTSKLLDLQVGGASKFRVGADGRLSGPGFYLVTDAIVHFQEHFAGNTKGALGSANGASWSVGGELGFNALNDVLSAAYTKLVSPGTGILEQRNGVNAQTFNIYNTYTNATNYERGHIGWNDTADTFVIGTEAGSGGGATRGLQLKVGTARVFEFDTALRNSSVGEGSLASASLSGPYNTASGYRSLYNNTSGGSNVATGSNNLYSNTTGNSNVASGVESLYSNTTGSNNTASGYQAGRYQSGGTTGLTTASNSVFLGATTKGIQGATNQIVIGDTAESIGANSVVLGNDSIVTTALKGNVGITSTWNDAADTFTLIKADVTDTASAVGSKLMDLQVGGVSKLSVDSSGTLSGTGGYKLQLRGGGTTTLPDIDFLGRLRFINGTDLNTDAANTLGQRNGVNAQTFNIYNTYTNATDYERAHIGWNDTADTFVIGTEAAGTGIERDISINAGLVSLQGDNELLRLSHIGAVNDRSTKAYITYYRGDNTNRIGYSGFSGENTFEISTDFTAGQFVLRTGNQVEALLVDSAGDATFAGAVGLHGVTPPAQASHIADPSGGATVDAESRTAINAILVALENIGITASV